MKLNKKAMMKGENTRIPVFSFNAISKKNTRRAFSKTYETKEIYRMSPSNFSPMLVIVPAIPIKRIDKYPEIYVRRSGIDS